MQKTLSVINLSAIRANAKLVKNRIGNRFFFAVVKADAYGHGAERVAAELEDVVGGFCVAIAEEGAKLRLCGIRKPILVLAPPLGEEDVRRIKYYNLTATVSGVAAAKLCKGCKCHIAVNTGMNRYGCHGKELDEVLSLLAPEDIHGVYSHLYAAEDLSESKKQLSAFEYCAKKVKCVNPRAIAHLSASAGILRGGSFLQDGVRCGIMLYGYAPASFRCHGLTPALKVYARLAQSVRPTGGGIGYNLADKKYGRLYTYRLGYADGFARGVPIGEKTLCMDAFISTEKHDLYPVMTNAERYARRCNTISYEVLCSVTKRSQRIYERPTEI